MRFHQVALLFLLTVLALAAFSATVILIYQGWTNPAAAAVSQADITTASAESTQVPEMADASPTRPPPSTATPTPFQPLPLTPTPTPSPLPTSTPLPTATLQPTNTPTAVPPPTQAGGEAYFINGIWGFPQAFNLSCESRSASDFARYFGVEFTELEFLYALPASDNPDEGFVGDVHDYLGQLPPAGYGVHARPVARLLRDFGLDAARSSRGLTLEFVQAEIAAGRPVMVWAIADMGYSQPVEYIASDGETVVVARFEHTFIVIGYGPGTITVLDNERMYSVTTEQFLASWGVLGNMGIFVEIEE